MPSTALVHKSGPTPHTTKHMYSVHTKEHNTCRHVSFNGVRQHMCCGAADATCTTLRLQHATESATCNCTFTAKPNQECDICLRQHDGLPTAARKASQTNGIWSVDRATTSTHACCLGTSMHAYAYAGSMCLVTGTASTTCGGTTVNAAADPEPATSTC
jgi:hypothetical protein